MATRMPSTIMNNIGNLYYLDGFEGMGGSAACGARDERRDSPTPYEFGPN
jgi:hypothetical protein